MDRRSFIEKSASLMSLALSPTLGWSDANDMGWITESKLINKIEKIPKIFCVAYVDPKIQKQRNQEPTVAKYPLAIVPQSMHKTSVAWRNKIKSINPDIMFLAYQMVIEETTVPGPGHDEFRKLSNVWSSYPGGYIPSVGPSNKKRRIFDPRLKSWQDAFINACRKTLLSYPYDGLFLDQCTIYVKAHPAPWVRKEMEIALQSTILKLRKEFPDKIIIGNSRYNWKGLNGEMTENRLKDADKEFIPFNGHVKPEMNLLMSYLRDKNDKKAFIEGFEASKKLGAFYAATVTAQEVLWFDEFDDLIQS